VEILEAVVIEITKIDPENHLLLGKDRRGEGLAFLYAPETKIRQINPQESIRPLRDFSRFPLAIGQEVLVTWKLNKTKQRAAIMITVYQ
jgi:hypothetical protein